VIAVFINILCVFVIGGIGFAANKLKWLPIESAKYLSLVLVNISNPCLILGTMERQEATAETRISFVHICLLMVAAFVIATLLSYFFGKILKMPKTDRGIYQAALVYTNCGFMGFPLALAVFGERGLFYMIAANVLFAVFVYSAGLMMILSGRKTDKPMLKTLTESIFSIPVISSLIGIAVFMLDINFPLPISNLFSTIGAMTIPLSMIIIGVQLAESNVGEIVKNKYLVETTVLKLLVFPALIFAAFMWLPIDRLVISIVVFSMVMPAAVVISVICEIYNANAKLAAQVVFVTTLFSLITIPVAGVLLTMFVQG